MMKQDICGMMEAGKCYEALHGLIEKFKP